MGVSNVIMAVVVGCVGMVRVRVVMVGRRRHEFR